MKRFAVALTVVAAVAVCVGAPAPRQAAADPSARGGDGLAGKFLSVHVRQSTGPYSTMLQNATVRRVGNREFLAGEVILLPDEEAKWQGAVVMLPLDQIEFIYYFDDREKLIEIMKDHKAKFAAQGVGESPPPPTYIVPPPVILPGGGK
jgi:hypothetical protein